MKITEVRIKLMESSEDRLRAFCSITIDDCFVVRDLKIIDGSNGPFVAMPSRKLTGHCNKCNHKNHLRAGYCNHCGSKLRGSSDGGYDSPQKLYADVAHPINSECREEIQEVVIEEFNLEIGRAAQPGYRSRYDDDFQEPEVSASEVAPDDGDVIDRDLQTDDGSQHIIDQASGTPSRPHFKGDSDESPAKRRRGERPPRRRASQKQTESSSSPDASVSRNQDIESQSSSGSGGVNDNGGDSSGGDSFGAGIFDS